jgi:hypothetical protein
MEEVLHNGLHSIERKRAVLVQFVGDLADAQWIRRLIDSPRPVSRGRQAG